MSEPIKQYGPERGMTALTALRIPLAVDGAMILSLVVGGTVMWQQLESLDRQQAELRQVVESERREARQGSIGNVDRLARIEERLIALQSDLGELKRGMGGR